MLGINRTTVGKYEHGNTNRVTLEMLEALAKVLNCDIKWLLGVDEEVEVEKLTDEEFYNAIKCTCHKYDDIGDLFTEDDYRDIIEYIKFKKMQKKGRGL